MTNVKDTIELEAEIRQLKEEIKETRLRYQAIDLNYDRRVEELDNLKAKYKDYFIGVDLHNSYVITKQAWESFNTLKQKLETIKELDLSKIIRFTGTSGNDQHDVHNDIIRKLVHIINSTEYEPPYPSDKIDWEDNAST